MKTIMKIYFNVQAFQIPLKLNFRFQQVLLSWKIIYSIPSMYISMARYLDTDPFSSTCHETFLQRHMAQGCNLWWWEASCTSRAFWQHSEFLVSAALAGRWWILGAPLLAQQEAAEVRMNSRCVPGSWHIIAWVVPVERNRALSCAVTMVHENSHIHKSTVL